MLQQIFSRRLKVTPLNTDDPEGCSDFLVDCQVINYPAKPSSAEQNWDGWGRTYRAVPRTSLGS